MAKTVSVIPPEGSPDPLGTTAKVLVGDADTAVDDVGVGLDAGVRVVDVVLVTLGAVGDGSETPGGRVLGCLGSLGELSVLGGFVFTVVILMVVSLSELVVLTRLSDLRVPCELYETIRLNGDDLVDMLVIISELCHCITYVRALLNLLNGGGIKGTRVGMKASLVVISLLNAIVGITLGETALMNILDPLDVSLDLGNLDRWLKGNDVTAGNNIAGASRKRGRSWSWSCYYAAKECGRHDGEVLEVDHNEW